MPRVTYVKRAQQRYATKPVIDPATGEQKRTPVMSRRTGQQRVTKRGRPVFMDVTERDLSKPLPMPRCDYPGCEHPDRTIQVGQSYKKISPKSGPYGGRTRYRHAEHPSWQPWEYSSSLSAMIAQVQHQFQEDLAGAGSPDDVRAALETAAEQVRELAEQKREAADNIRDGFGHDTYQSEDLDSQADELETWADDIENVSVPEPADYPCERCQGDGEAECYECGGTGENQDDDSDLPNCQECVGGVVECDECDDDHADMDAWREAVEGEVSVVDEAPL